jgi:hypothetical protein
LSPTIPKHGDQKVSPIGMKTLPSAAKASNTRLAAASKSMADHDGDGIAHGIGNGVARTCIGR